MSFLFDCLVLLQRHFWNVLEYIHFLSHWMSISFSPLSLSYKLVMAGGRAYALGIKPYFLVFGA